MGSNVSASNKENPRTPVIFSDKKVQKIYESIIGRIKIYEIQNQVLEKKEDYQGMAVKVYRLEELDYVVMHLKRHFKFKDIESE